MDGDLVSVAGDQHDDLEQVAGPVGPEEQPAIGVFTGIFDGQAWSMAWRTSSSATPCRRAELWISTTKPYYEKHACARVS
ncbi:MAG: hypothetical protein M3376_10645 [Actinomycetota bacterium]|nr:hypothetical protein [Actinomycetota bacterium]